jgi:hypothetical protein
MDRLKSRLLRIALIGLTTLAAALGAPVRRK